MGKKKCCIGNRRTGTWIRKGILGWLCAVSLEYVLLPKNGKNLESTEAFGHMSWIRVLGVMCAVTGTFILLSHWGKSEKIEKWGICGLFVLLGGMALHNGFRWAFLCGWLLILLILFVQCNHRRKNYEEPRISREKSGKGWGIFTGVMTVMFFLFVSLWTVARVFAFRTPTYDFGIFSQMFYYMKETGLPLTTLEREGLLSHFAVHVSPIYYVLLPFYWLFPYPVTLQVLQGGIMASAVIPLWKLGKHFQWKDSHRALLCVLLLLYPAFSGGAGYDIHENCFLTPLLLWLFYSIEKKTIPFTGVVAVLTLCVKEDGAVYVGVIGLWLLVRTLLQEPKKDKKELLTAMGLLGLSLLWFYCGTTYLKNHGDGVMSNRYSNLMGEGEQSLLWVVRNVLLHPMKALYECTDGEKLKYIGLTMIPLLGLPLLTSRCERYLLLIPYVLVNLLSDYPYQHHIFFQYSFGSIAFFMYLVLVNGNDLRRDGLKTLLLLGMVILSATAFALTVVPKAMTYPALCMENKEENHLTGEILEDIPEEATVTASTFYTVALSQRFRIYDLGYASLEQLRESDFVVLDPGHPFTYEKYATKGQNNGLENLLSLLEQEGFVRIQAIEHRLYVYQKS